MILGSQGLPLTSTTGLEDNAAWFRELLTRYGITPPDNSYVAICLADAEYLGAKRKGMATSRRPLVNYFFHSRVLGLDYHIRALRRAFEHADADVFRSHLRAFRGPNMSLFAKAKRTPERDLAWEFLVGCLVGSFARDLKMTTGPEPDVVCSHGDLTLGVECKVLYSDEPDTQMEAIVHGAKQLEASHVDFGFVAAFATNATRPGGFQRWPLRKFSTGESATTDLRREISLSVSGINQEWFLQRLTSDLRTNRPRFKTRGVLFVAQAVADVQSVTASLTTAVGLSFRDLKVPGCDSFMSSFILKPA